MLLSLRLLLILSACDLLLGGLWAICLPRSLFDLLGQPPRTDAWSWQLLQPGKSRLPEAEDRDVLLPPRDAGLWHLLGVLFCVNGGILLVVCWRPSAFTDLVWAPFLCRLFGVGLWLWTLGAAWTFPPSRQPFPEVTPLMLLAGREAVGAFLLAVFLFLARKPR